jgi:hypothetical protein
MIEKSRFTQPLLESFIGFLVRIGQTEGAKARRNKGISESQNATSWHKITQVGRTVLDPSFLILNNLSTRIAELNKLMFDSAMGALVIFIALLVGCAI